jgi:hypothetical protein
VSRSPVDQVCEQRGRDGRVLRRALSEHLRPVGRDPQRHDVGDVGQLDPVDHYHRQLQPGEIPAEQLRQRGTGLGHERARGGRLRRRARLGSDLLADRLINPARATRRHAGQHPLQHKPAEQITRGELLVAIELDLLGVIRGPHPRPTDRHPASTERHLPRRVTVALADPPPIVLALRADDPLDLPLHRLV